MTSENLDTRIIYSVVHFRALKNSHQIKELNTFKAQFKNMAEGGNGGEFCFGSSKKETGLATIREVNYPEMPDFFFQEVNDLMGWK